MRALTRLLTGVCLLGAVLPSAAALGQSPSFYGTAVFHLVITDPRARALGEAPVALRGYAAAPDLNPAAIGKDGFVQVWSNLSFDVSRAGITPGVRVPWLDQPGIWVTSPGFDVKHGRWAAAYRFKHLNADLGQLGDPAGPTYVHADHSHKLSLAYDVRPSLTVGAGVNLLTIAPPMRQVGNHIEPAGGRERSVSFDVGLRYERHFALRAAGLRAAAGWSITDFGPRVRFELDPNRFPLSMVMRTGVSLEAETKARRLRLPLVTVGLHGALSKSLVNAEPSADRTTFEADGPFEALFSSWRPFKIRTNALSPGPARYTTVTTFDQIKRHTGLEVGLLQTLFVRLGHFHEHAYDGNRQYTTAGFGIDLYYAALDYAATILGEAGTAMRDVSFWRLTARIPFGPPRDNLWKALRDARRSSPRSVTSL